MGNARNFRTIMEEIRPFEVLADVLEETGIPLPRYNERERRIEIRLPDRADGQRRSPFFQALFGRPASQESTTKSSTDSKSGEFPDLGSLLAQVTAPVATLL